MHQRTPLFIDALPLTTDRTSGIGHMIAALITELSARQDVRERYEIILFGPRSGEANALRWNFPGVVYRPTPFPKRAMTALNFAGLLPPIDRFLGGGVYLFGNFVNYPVTKASRSVTYVHDVCYLRHPEFLRPKVRRILQTQLPRWMRRTDSIVTVSEDAASDITAFYPRLAPKVHVVLNGVDQAHFYRRSEQEIGAIKKELSISGEYIVFVGNIEPRKNLARLITAFTQLPAERRSSLSLVLVGGDGWLDEPINKAIEFARASGATIIRPESYVTDDKLPALYSGAKAAVLVSEHEGFGMPLIEAMSCGAPVLASDIPSLREVVGEHGTYVAPRDVEDITMGLIHITSRGASNGRRLADAHRRAERFSWSRSADKLLSILDDQAGQL